VPAQEPKKGLRYEILVAAELKTQRQEFDGKSLDLTSFAFNVNPPPFVSNLTRIGFDVSVDLVATSDSLTHIYIECKSSSTPEYALKQGSEEFLKAMLEFVALQSFSETAEWQYQYVLVVNVDVGKDLMSLFKDMSAEQINRLMYRMKKFGARKYGSKFNAELISTDILRRTLGVTTILHLSDQYLKERHRSDSNFRQYCEHFSAQWRTSRSNAVPDRGTIISQGHPCICFLCKSKTHDNCTEIIIDGFICHIGNLSKILRRVLAAYEKMKSPVCCLIRSREIGYSISDIAFDERISSKDVAGALSSALNNSSQLATSSISLIVVPGTYDIVVADTIRLAERVRSAYELFSGKYNLCKISELKGLGMLVKTLIAREVLRHGYKIMTSSDDYLVEEDIDGCDFCEMQ